MRHHLAPRESGLTAIDGRQAAKCSLTADKPRNVPWQLENPRGCATPEFVPPPRIADVGWAGIAQI